MKNKTSEEINRFIFIPPLMIPLIKWTSFIISILFLPFSAHSIVLKVQWSSSIYNSFRYFFFFFLLLFSYKFFFLFICVKWEILYTFFGRCWWCFIFHVILFRIGKKLNIFIVNRLTGDFNSSFKSAPFSHTQYTYFMCYIKYRMGSEVKKYLQLKFLFYFGRLNWVRRF